MTCCGLAYDKKFALLSVEQVGLNAGTSEVSGRLVVEHITQTTQNRNFEPENCSNKLGKRESVIFVRFSEMHSRLHESTDFVKQ